MTWKKHQFWAKNTATHRGKRLPSPSWHCSVVKGFGCSWLWPAPIRLNLMFGRGPRWGSKINIMFSFFRALFARTTCRFVVSLCQSTFYQPIFKCIKKIFPREGSACHILFFHNTVYKTLKRTKSSPALWNQHSVYTRYLIHCLCTKKKKKKMHRTWKKQNKKNMQYTAMSVPFLSFLYTYIIGLPFTVITSHFTGITISRLIQYKDDALPVQEFPLCRYDNLRTILSSQW